MTPPYPGKPTPSPHCHISAIIIACASHHPSSHPSQISPMISVSRILDEHETFREVVLDRSLGASLLHKWDHSTYPVSFTYIAFRVRVRDLQQCNWPPPFCDSFISLFTSFIPVPVSFVINTEFCLCRITTSTSSLSETTICSYWSLTSGIGLYKIKTLRNLQLLPDLEGKWKKDCLWLSKSKYVALPCCLCIVLIIYEQQLVQLPGGHALSAQFQEILPQSDMSPQNRFFDCWQ